MESISNPDCMGCAPTNSISDAEAAVARYDFGARMLTKPNCLEAFHVQPVTLVGRSSYACGDSDARVVRPRSAAW
jgi:hypothetical protein